MCFKKKKKTWDDWEWFLYDHPKMQYLNFKDIEYIWHGSWPDPELVYRGRHLNYWDVEEYFYDFYEQDMLEAGHEIDGNGNCKGGITYENGAKEMKTFAMKC